MRRRSAMFYSFNCSSLICSGGNQCSWLHHLKREPPVTSSDQSATITSLRRRATSQLSSRSRSPLFHVLKLRSVQSIICMEYVSAKVDEVRQVGSLDTALHYMLSNSHLLWSRCTRGHESIFLFTSWQCAMCGPRQPTHSMVFLAHTNLLTKYFCRRANCIWNLLKTNIIILKCTSNSQTPYHRDLYCLKKSSQLI